MRTVAHSISRPVRAYLRRTPAPTLEVLAVFDRACNLVGLTEEGRRPVVAVVTPEVGKGPLNVVVERCGWRVATIEPRVRARVEEGGLRIGDLRIELGLAQIWEPRPDWLALRRRRNAIRTRLRQLRAYALEKAGPGSLLTRLEGISPGETLMEASVSAARSSLRDMEAGWGGETERLLEGVAQIAGLGRGLTPSGDDFLCGAMLWAWLAHSNPARFCRAIAETAGARTTTLSTAFLWAAAEGACSAGWHTLLNALAAGTEVRVARTAGDVLAQGATSGADTLAGFLWAGMLPVSG